MAAVFALDLGKAVDEIAAIQKPLHNLFDTGAKEAAHPFKTIYLFSFDMLKGNQAEPFPQLIVNLYAERLSKAWVAKLISNGEKIAMDRGKKLGGCLKKRTKKARVKRVLITKRKARMDE